MALEESRLRGRHFCKGILRKPFCQILIEPLTRTGRLIIHELEFAARIMEQRELLNAREPIRELVL